MTQSEDAGLPKNPLYPEMVFIDTNDGLAVDVVATAKNYEESMLPELSFSYLRVNDVIWISFYNAEKLGLKVIKVNNGSLVFGSDSLLNPNLTCEDTEGNLVHIAGSSILPSGNMAKASTIKQGCYLIYGFDEVSSSIVSDFAVQRQPDDGGEPIEVPPNALVKKQEVSKEYKDVNAIFLSLFKQIEATGFEFDKEIDSRYGSYFQISDSGFVYASREGFGSGIIPQYEIYVYDKENGVLRALRAAPGEGVLQMAVMNISPEDLAKTSYTDDWKKIKSLGKSNLHRGLKFSPITTYTWQDSNQILPTITILTRSHGLDDKLLAGNNSISDFDHVPGEVNIIISDDCLPRAKAVNPCYWVDQNTYENVFNSEVRVVKEGSNVRCTIGSLELALPLSPDDEMRTMETELSRIISNRIIGLGSTAIDS